MADLGDEIDDADQRRVTTPRPPFRGVLFDMDGVLTDSEPAFYAAVNDVLARYNHHIATADYAPYIGSATPAMWSAMIERFRLPASLDAILDEYEPPLMARLRERRPPLPGARELIDTLRARRVPIALCTASYRRWVDAILAGADLAGLFDVIVAGEDVACPKPDPEPYVSAARLLGLDPRDCVALEDSVNGLTSALRAGAYVIQLRATGTAAPPVDGVALVIRSLAEFPLDLLRDSAAPPSPRNR